MAILADEEEWRTYPIAAGKWETMTPVGEWRVVDKGVRVGAVVKDVALFYGLSAGKDMVRDIIQLFGLR